MLDALKQNIETEIEVLREISNNIRRLDYASPSERKLLQTSVESLRASLKLVNNSIPKLLEEISLVQRLPQKEKATGLEKVEFKGEEAVIKVTLNKEDREKFLQQLSINENLVKKLKKKRITTEEKVEEFKAARGYLKLSNMVFLNKAQALIRKGYLKSLSVELKKANIDILFASYVAMTLLTTAIAFFVSFVVTAFLIFYNVQLSYPFFVLYEGSYLSRLVNIFWIPIIVPLATFFILNYYPSTERDSLAKRIDQELPFAVIHMSSISGSGIEPTQIFKIIGLNREYPFLRKEIRKILNQINLYGYDLVTALNNVSKTTPSVKLAELFSGLSTTITSGGNLSEFFSKRAETLLLSYRLDRERYTKVAETFMDIYISIVIAAPMILMILMVLISLSSYNVGLSIGQLTALIIGVMGVINIIFIFVLHLKQPRY